MPDGPNPEETLSPEELSRATSYVPRDAQGPPRKSESTIIFPGGDPTSDDLPVPPRAQIVGDARPVEPSPPATPQSPAAPSPQARSLFAETTAEPPPAAEASREARAKGDSRRRIPEKLGSYEIVKLLGEGGMGAVYRAFDPMLRREVAVKVMRQADGASANARARFLREARAAAAVHDDHVVTIYHVDEADGDPYIVMPLLIGESLDARLSREKILSAADVAKIGRETALGLAAAHAQGLVHRDVKPANLWLERVGERWRVKVLDFGLARAVEGVEERVTVSGALLGTPQFMSPEQAEGRSVDARSDLFSLGAVLYEAATGKAAFDRETVWAVLRAVRVDDPPPACTVNPSLPAELSDVIAWLMQKDPSQRPETAEDAAAAFGPGSLVESALGGEQPTDSAVGGSSGARKRPTDGGSKSGMMRSSVRSAPAHPPTASPGGAKPDWTTGRLGTGLAVAGGIAIFAVAASSFLPSGKPAPLAGATTSAATSHGFATTAGTAAAGSGPGGEAVGSGTAVANATSGNSSTVSTAAAGIAADLTGALRVTSIDVHHFARRGEAAEDRGVFGRDTFAAVQLDQVTLDAKLSRPAYAYVLAFRPDGQAELCFPEDESEAPPKTDRPRYPWRPESRDLRYGLSEAPGLWVFAVVASDDPLPSFKEWKGKHPLPPAPVLAAAPGTVWWDDGRHVESLAAGRIGGVERGKGERALVPAAMTAITNGLRDSLPHAASAAVGIVAAPPTE